MNLRVIGIAAFTVFFVSGFFGQAASGNDTVFSESNVQKLVGGFKFTEGPATDTKGNVYFTDIPNSRIHKWSLDGKLSTFIEKSDGANGLFFDKDGNLLACAGGAGKLVSIDSKGKVTVLASSYQGKRFNSPNDLWIDANGGIYFTDPRYGSRENLPQDGEHVYYLSADRKKLVRVVDNMVRPNGVIGTDDGKLLYVADHGDSKTYSYKIKPDGTLSGKKLFAEIGSDGMTLDADGNVYLTTDAVYVYNPSGKLIKTIEVPERPSNVCFGGKNNKTLFITARKSLYCVDMVAGVGEGDAALSKSQAAEASEQVWEDVAKGLRKERQAEWQDKEIRIGDKVMRFDYRLFGTAGAGGRSLYISMHGGGGAPAAVNDSQWKNQIGLYKTPEGSLYIAPRAPTNTWNLWHQGHIDKFFDRIITDAIVFANVNPDKVYLLGYSAGGDGVYQLAPRMADRFAAASMMAGHPNEASPLGLRNIPFSIWMGEKDRAYGRNRIAAEWGGKLDELEKADPQGYKHQLHIVAGKGHWMDREDAAAIDWMAKFKRNRFPKKVVWRQDNITHDRFYWLAVDEGASKAGAEVVAVIDGQTIRIEKSTGVKRLKIRLNDEMLNLDQPVTVTWNGQCVYTGTPKRSMAMIRKSMTERVEPGMTFCSEIVVSN